MYTYYYPETNQRFSCSKEHEFETAKKAADYWRNRKGWEDITIPGSETAFMFGLTGEIIVVRKIDSIG